MKLIEIAQAGAMTDAPRLIEVGNNVVNFLLRIFGFVGIIGLVIAGLLYLFANGNQDTIELAKKATFFSIVGIVIVVGIMIILKIISNLLG